jgi:hypothetical protein
MRRLLSILVVLSSLAMLFPMGLVAAKPATMACCIGKKEANHCHAKLKSNQTAAGHDHSAPSGPAFETVTSRHPCHSDCCACFFSSRQQKRERGTVQPIARYVPPTVVVSDSTYVPAVAPAIDDYQLTAPRGPPASAR